MLFSINAGLLDACVLSLLKKEDSYGYKLTQDVKELLPISESSLYPVLKRLNSNGYLTTYDSPIDGRNRKYYKITESGIQKHKLYIEEWTAYKKLIDGIFNSKTI